MLFTACCIFTTTLTEKYHIAVVCISVTHHLMTSRSEAINATHTVHPLTEALDLLSHHFSYNHHKTPVDYNLSVNIAPCMATWCISPHVSILQVVDRIQVRLLVFVKTFKHV